MDDVTLGEVARRVEALHSDVKEMRDRIVTHDDLRLVATAWEQLLTAHESNETLRITALDARVTVLEAFQTWAVRIVVGAVLVSAVGLLLAHSP